MVRFAPMKVSTSAVGSGMIISVITMTRSATIAMSLCRAIALTIRLALLKRVMNYPFFCQAFSPLCAGCPVR